MEALELSRRCKRFLLGDGHVLELFRNRTKPAPEMAVPGMQADISQDALILSVHHDFARSAFIVIICDPSWPIIEEGTEIPFVQNTEAVWFELDPRYRRADWPVAPPFPKGSRAGLT